MAEWVWITSVIVGGIGVLVACRFVFLFNRNQIENGNDEGEEDETTQQRRPLLGKSGKKGSLLNLSPGKELQPLPPRFVPPPPLDCTVEGLKAETLKVWGKTRDKLPIGVDLPRLVRKIVVVNHTGTVLFSGVDHDTHPSSSSSSSPSKLNNPIASSSSSSSSSEGVGAVVDPVQVESANNAKTKQMIFELLHTLTREIDGDELETMEKKFSELNGALDGDLALFLRPFIEEYLTEDHALIGLLKVCNQSILAAAVVRMKTQFGSSYNYKDNRGGWLIDIVLREDKGVTVTHTKKEISWEKPDLYDSQHFSFSWSFSIDIPSDYSTVTAVRLVVETVDFLESVSPSKRLDVLKSMQSCTCASLSPSCLALLKHYESSA
eukprot:TRINITY_DN8557_c0_g1_i1.p1 TRINITY_DN8557_c0_g1~~TRINITY_DN8557_c0_g1_i1.p1  ORF type:complete len:378 (-),score=170.71 TRINITY_DN8557_c0_g1_i1:132-1265(-)